MILGEQFEIDRPDCFTSEDCQHGGVCIKGICNCLKGFNGPICENS